MAAKPEVLFNQETHLYQVQMKKADGSTQVQDRIESIELMDSTQAVQVFLGLAKDAPNKRAAAATLVASIMDAYGDQIEAWRGNGDKGQPLSRELSGTFQRLEVKWFERFLEKDHPYHEQFMNRLPAMDGRGQSLDANGKPNWQARFDAFLTLTRKDAAYSNTKSIILYAFSLLGIKPVGDDGRLVPPEALSAMVRAAKTVIPVDNSYKAKLGILYRILTAGSDEGEAPKDEELPAIVAMLGEMFAQAKSLENAAATRATQQPRGSIAQQAGEAIQQAQQAPAPTPTANAEGFKVVSAE